MFIVISFKRQSMFVQFVTKSLRCAGGLVDLLGRTTGCVLGLGGDGGIAAAGSCLVTGFVLVLSSA